MIRPECNLVLAEHNSVCFSNISLKRTSLWKLVYPKEFKKTFIQINYKKYNFMILNVHDNIILKWLCGVSYLKLCCDENPKWYKYCTEQGTKDKWLLNISCNLNLCVPWGEHTGHNSHLNTYTIDNDGHHKLWWVYHKFLHLSLVN